MRLDDRRIFAPLHGPILMEVICLLWISFSQANENFQQLRTIYRGPSYYPIPETFHQKTSEVFYKSESPIEVNDEPFVSRVSNDDDDDLPEITWGKPNTRIVYFDDTTDTNVTAVVGQKATLPCTIVNIGRKDVTWIRRRDIHILTVGKFTYTSDDRFKVTHPKDSDDWNLEIQPLTFRDAGVYECQVSTSPKISLPVLLAVDVQQAKIPGPNELFIRNGSTISLICRVNTHSENVGSVTWFRNGHRLDYDSSRGGVSLEVEKTLEKTTSKLHITRAVKVDSGNYTCAPQFAEAASVMVHVVSGEESAAVQTGKASTIESDHKILTWSLIFICFRQLFPIVQNWKKYFYSAFR